MPIRIDWTDKRGKKQWVVVDDVKTWQVRDGGTREHPEGTVIEGHRDGIGGVLQLDADDRVGDVTITVMAPMRHRPITVSP